MSANGEPKHGDVFTDADGYTRVVLESSTDVWFTLLFTPSGHSFMSDSMGVKPFKPSDSVYKFNLVDVISNILKDSHEHSD
jgi:hypothetical protein